MLLPVPVAHRAQKYHTQQKRAFTSLLWYSNSMTICRKLALPNVRCTAKQGIEIYRRLDTHSVAGVAKALGCPSHHCTTAGQDIFQHCPVGQHRGACAKGCPPSHCRTGRDIHPVMLTAVISFEPGPESSDRSHNPTVHTSMV